MKLTKTETHILEEISEGGRAEIMGTREFNAARKLLDKGLIKRMDTQVERLYTKSGRLAESYFAGYCE
jgi:hypothetical protein